MATSPAQIISRTEITTGAAARILCTSQDTVARLCEEGILRARRLRTNGYWMIDYASAIEYRNKLRSI